ncbi:MAG: hypothetical protein E7638_03100 [Ruminococcaceae bacterium]|nr:hypothetical protein [Oscillospiraceae bacterium]
MFTVKPVREKELQEALAKVFGCEYFPDSYAFLAGNSDDGETLTSLLGFSQFMMNSDRDAVILNVTPAPNYYDEEVIIIMVRTLMNFVYRAGIPVIYLDDAACSEDEAKKFGFRRVDDRWCIDLKKFYISPCHYNPDEK